MVWKLPKKKCLTQKHPKYKVGGMNLKGLLSLNEFHQLSEKIAVLIDDYLNTNMEDLSNINHLIEREIQVAYRKQGRESVEINGGSK